MKSTTKHNSKTGVTTITMKAGKGEDLRGVVEALSGRKFETEEEYLARMNDPSRLDHFRPESSALSKDYVVEEDPRFKDDPRVHCVGNAELDAGVPNHYDPNKRGFSPR